jgi:hypothetical protein
LISCVSILRPPSANATGPRVIILNDKVISEDDVGGFTSWYCRDYVYEDRVLLEFGYFNDPNLSGIGFILYDGGYTGEFTLYQRSGVEHRWDWGPNETDYSFVIKPDGIGLYYDFSYARKGESIKARDVYKCYKR